METGIPDQEPQIRNQELGNRGTGTTEQEQRLQEQSCSGTQRCQTGTRPYGNRNPRSGATNQELGNHGTGTPEQEQRFQEQADRRWVCLNFLPHFKLKRDCWQWKIEEHLETILPLMQLIFPTSADATIDSLLDKRYHFFLKKRQS
ncbi:unnamed protein product [Lepidochelys olivacea]